MRKFYSAVVLLLGLSLAGCFSDGSDPNRPPRNTTSTGIDTILGDDFDLNTDFRPLFDPFGLIMPYPNDIQGFLISPDSDGSLNLVQPPTSFQVLFNEVNLLDGFSTYGRFTANFSETLDASSLANPGAVTVLEVVLDPATKATIGVVGGLIPGIDYEAVVADDVASGGVMLEINPLIPLNPKSGYLVILTNAILDTSGTPAVPDTTYQLIKDALAAGVTLPDPTQDLLKQFIGAHLQIAAAVQIDPANVVVTASFSTVSVTDALDTINASAAPQFSLIEQLLAPADLPIPGGGVLPAGTPITTGVVLSLLGFDTQCGPTATFPLPGCGISYAGAMGMPYFLEPPLDQNDPNAVTSFWEGTPGANPLDSESITLTRYNPAPNKKANLLIPMIMTTPSPNSQYVLSGGTKPPTGWPVMIYYHGVTRNRLDMYAVTESWNNAGYAVVAVDHPFHGITATDPAEDPTALFRIPGVDERTFDLDLVQNDNPASGPPDGLIDPSGIHYLNPAPDRLLPTSDKARESISTIIHLLRTIPTMDIDGDGNPDFDGSRIHSVGESLGGWATLGTAAINNEMVSTTSVYPASSLSQALFESESFKPLADGLTAALAANGILPGTTAFNNYLRDFQNLIDAGDPISYGYAWSKNQVVPIHMIMVDGDATAPNESTRRLQDAMGLPQVPLAQPPVFPFPILVGSTDPVQGTNGVNGGLVFFTSGAHGSFISPDFGPAVTIEMQTEAVVFGAGNPLNLIPGNGQVILISDMSVVDTDGQD